MSILHKKLICIGPYRVSNAVLATTMFCLAQFFTPAIAQEKVDNPRVGKAFSVVNFVIGDNLSELRQLSADDPVYALERISAEPDSHGEILLDDNSKIIVGPGAEISLDDFVVANNNINAGTINVLKGAFRFISGDAPKGTFKVKTPLSTIGIRGTLFDVYVDDKGRTDVIIYSGRVEVCTLDNKCRELHKTCDIVRVSSKKRIRAKRFLRAGNKNRENTIYNLVDDQSRFREGWRAPIELCDARGANSYRGLQENFNSNDTNDNNPSEGIDVDAGGTTGGYSTL